MEDRKLLEAAAKAAGLNEWGWMSEKITHVVDNRFVFWEPLESDGDALRLAVQLGISVSTPDDGDEVASATHWSLTVFCAEKAHADRYAATRRAIVRAAAALATARAA